jgi:Ca2+/H+ antiporter, TMEM165/GDT1 family
LKFVVGILLTAFGVFWTGEGLGIDWPGGDLVILTFIAIFLVASLLSVPAAREIASEERHDPA